MFKPFLVVLCALLSVFGMQTASAEWTSVDMGTFATINAASYPETNAVWACDSDGSVWASSDAGQTWVEQTNFAFSNLTGIAFADDMFGTAASEFGAAYSTTDGGATWTTVFEAWTTFFEVATIPGTSSAWVGGQNTVMQPFLIWTHDAWATQDAAFFYYDINNVLTEGYIRGLAPISANDLIAVGNTWLWDGGICMSSDGGTTWETTWVGSGNVVWDVAANANGIAIAVTDLGSILRSTDMGATWTTVDAGNGNALHGVAAASNDVFWAVGNAGTIMTSNDGGVTWTVDDSGSIANLQDVAFLNESTGVAVGETGTMLVYSAAPSDPVTLTLNPTVTTVPATGGDVVYDASVTSTLGNPISGRAWTVVTTPGGTDYVTMNIPVTVTPSGFSVTGLTQTIPSYAPEGIYTFTANLGYYPNFVAAADDFSFEKTGVAAAGASNWNASEWIIAGEETADVELPMNYTMSAAYPNPFNPTTSVAVTLPETSDLTVSVYNVEGQLVGTLANGKFSAGHHSFTFIGTNLASGIYFIQAQVPGNLDEIQKVTLMK